MLYRHRIPRPPLDAFIESIWLCETDPRPHALERILPTGAAQLIVNLKEDQTRVYHPESGNRCDTTSGTVVGGARSRYCVIEEDRAMTDSMDTYRTITPYLVVPDADAELTFLKTAFGGAEVTCQRNADNSVMHAEIRIGNSLIMLGQSGDQWKALNAALYLWVEDVDTTYEKALRAGATSQSAPEDKPYGHRNAGVVDQNGITWWIGAPIH